MPRVGTFSRGVSGYHPGIENSASAIQERKRRIGVEPRMNLRPVTLREANDFVEAFHRHNQPVAGGRFAIGLEESNELVGVAIVGRPIARQIEHHYTAEVLRTCTNVNAGKGAVSKLYAACWRAWRAMGGTRLITYTLKSESGASLRGAGWRVIGEVTGTHNGWSRESRLREWQPVMGQQKLRWEVTA